MWEKNHRSKEDLIGILMTLQPVQRKGQQVKKVIF